MIYLRINDSLSYRLILNLKVWYSVYYISRTESCSLWDLNSASFACFNLFFVCCSHLLSLLHQPIDRKCWYHKLPDPKHQEDWCVLCSLIFRNSFDKIFFFSFSYFFFYFYFCKRQFLIMLSIILKVLGHSLIRNRHFKWSVNLDVLLSIWLCFLVIFISKWQGSMRIFIFVFCFEILPLCSQILHWRYFLISKECIP